MIGQYHYPHKKVMFMSKGPSNGFHWTKKATYGTFLALEDPILTGLGLFLDILLLIHIQ